MTVPTHLRVVFRGVFTGTPETWSFGLKFSRDNPAGGDASYADIDTAGMKDACATFFSYGGARIPSNVQLMDVRSYIIGTNGLTEGNPEIVVCESENIKGGATPVYPPQVACVVTHVASNRGPARFGRTYLPTAAPIQASDSRMAVATATALRDAYTTFVKSCSDKVDLEDLASSEGLNISASQGGVRQTIDHHEIGLALDTLRSRRKALLEERAVGGHIDW